MSLLTVGLCFNLRVDSPPDGPDGGPEDAQAEYDSWSTVSALAEALSFDGACRVLPLPFGPDLPELLRWQRPDVVFNIAEGAGGRSRESLAPALFELLRIPYTGSDPVALGMAMDKSLARWAAAAAGLPVAWGAVAASPQEVEQVVRQAPLPAFVKPVAEGSSKGVRQRSRVESRDELREQALWVLREYRQPALVEEYLPGREFSVGVLGNGEALAVLPVLEVRPGGEDGAFVYCYHTKSGNREQFLCPAPVDEELGARLAAGARRVFSALGLRDVARVDFRLSAGGLPCFLEVNPLPGLSAASLLTAQARAAGMSLNDLVAAILQAACRRWVAQPDLDQALKVRLARLEGLLRELRPPAAPGPGGDGYGFETAAFHGRPHTMAGSRPA